MTNSSPPTRATVSVSRTIASKRLAERLQHEIAGAMPADVVHVLEAVEVDRDEGERLARAPRAAERLLDAVVEQHTVREAGERVAERFRVSVLEAPIEDDACRGGDEREHDESRRNVVGCLAEDGREQARAEHERGQDAAPTRTCFSVAAAWF